MTAMTTLLQLEEQKAEMLALVAGWSEARLTYRPEAGAWSTAEMFDHMVKVEIKILAASRKGLLSPHSTGLSDQLRTAFLKHVFQSDRRVKVPASARQVLPDTQPSFAGVSEGWAKCRAELAQFVDTFPASHRHHGLFHHPVGGWMNLAEVLNFFSVHMVHHGFQLARLSAGSKAL